MLAHIMKVGEEYYTDESGRKQGEYKSWYSNGNQEEISNYINDKLDGEYRSWRSNGRRHTYAFFKNGAIHGECKAWHKDNDIPTRHEFCDCGEVITDEIRKVVCDITNLSGEDRLVIKLRFGLETCRK